MEIRLCQPIFLGSFLVLTCKVQVSLSDLPYSRLAVRESHAQVEARARSHPKPVAIAREILKGAIVICVLQTGMGRNAKYSRGRAIIVAKDVGLVLILAFSSVLAAKISLARPATNVHLVSSALNVANFVTNSSLVVVGGNAL